jgi:MFS transporter, DHA3 family, macrolide efflux protein
LAGPLADGVFEPAMMPGGGLAPLFGRLVGTGAGAGMALILVLVGLLGAAVTWSGYLSANVRNVEDLLPDHVQAAAPPMGLGAS